MNTYQAFSGNGRTLTVEAETSWAAQKKAAELFGVKPKKVYMVSVILVAVGDRIVPLSTASL